MPSLLEAMTKGALAPKGFNSLKDCQACHFTVPPAFASGKPARTPDQRKGLRYEGRVISKLEREALGTWEGFPHPWLRAYDGAGNSRLMQCDWVGINVKLWRVLIVEIKLTATAQGWWQLNRLYRPALEKVFPKWDVSLLMITSEMRVLNTPTPLVVVSDWSLAPVNKTSIMWVDYRG